MRRYAQLTPDEQAQAVQLVLDQLTSDPELLTDGQVRPRLDALATQRARTAFYLDAGDQIVSLTTTTALAQP